MICYHIFVPTLNCIDIIFQVTPCNELLVRKNSIILNLNAAVVQIHVMFIHATEFSHIFFTLTLFLLYYIYSIIFRFKKLHKLYIFNFRLIFKYSVISLW